MKKTLVTLLALVFVLGIAGTAFAAPANPFVDVPAKHWAYGAVAKLVKAGVVDGYGDGTFRGDRAMTRYEMAQVVAKAMAKSEKADAETKALIDKLAVEFAAELNNLGVRVAKLEKNASNIKLSGDARIRYTHADKGTANPGWAQRFRLVATADVNDNTSLYARWQVLATTDFGTYDSKKTNQMADANLTTKNVLPNVSATLGRYSLALGETTYFAGSTGGFDGAELIWKEGKSALKFGYADTRLFNDGTFVDSNIFNKTGNIMYAQLNHKFDNAVKASLFYVKNQDDGVDAQKQVDVTGVGITWNMNKDWMFVGDYWRNSAKLFKDALGSTPKALVARVQYGVAKPAVPGSWQIFAEYTKFDYGTIDTNWFGAMVNVGTYNATPANGVGLKAYDVQYTTVLAKNLTFDAIYQFNMKNAKTGANYYSTGGDKYTRLQFNYMF